jgi:hypothetical protein
MSVEFKDYSMQVKAALNDTTKAWLYEWANETASQARDNCTMTDDDGQLKGSYRADVDTVAGEAKIGTHLESGYWEEYGTGEYAVHGDGRKGWWVYIDGGSGYKKETKHYTSRQEAEKAANFLRRVKKMDAVVTNGRKPAATLEKAFTKTKPKAEADLENRLKGL